jgi:hypothetical protein
VVDITNNDHTQSLKLRQPVCNHQPRQGKEWHLCGVRYTISLGRIVITISGAKHSDYRVAFCNRLMFDLRNSLLGSNNQARQSNNVIREIVLGHTHTQRDWIQAGNAGQSDITYTKHKYVHYITLASRTNNRTTKLSGIVIAHWSPSQSILVRLRQSSYHSSLLQQMR